MNMIAEARTRQVMDACLSLVFGVLLILFPNIGAGALSIVAASIFYVVGAFYIFIYIWMFIYHDFFLLVRGFLFIMAATLIMLYPADFLLFVTILTSIALVVQGVYQFVYSMELSSIKDKYWYVDFIYSLLLFLSGLMLLLSKPVFGIEATVTYMIMAGIMFIVDGIFDLVIIYVLKRDFNFQELK